MNYLHFILIIFITVFSVFSNSLYSSVTLSFQNLDTNIIYFSPNYDGSQDTVIMRPKTDETKKLDNWFVTIYNDQNKAVRVFQGKGNDARTNFSLVMNEVLSGKESTELPIIVEWDGLSDFGKILPEGKYYAILKTVDFTGFIQESGTNWIVMKYTAPKATIALDDLIFNPTPEGRKKTIHISQELSPGDYWKAEIRDRDSNPVMRWDWGTNAPSELYWDGKSYKGSTLPEGSYDYILYGSDLAGNRTVMPVKGLNLSLKKYSLFLKIENPVFSPKADLQFNTARIFPVVSDTNGIVSWNISIRNQNNTNVFETNGENLPEVISWNGHDLSNNNILPDGIYNSRIKIAYFDDDTPESLDYPIIIYTESPQLEAKFGPLPFSPDGDGENDILSIQLISKDKAGIKAWKSVITDPDGRPFKTFSGMGRPSTDIHWDGRSDNGELVQSASDYHLYVSAIDNAGNISANLDKGAIPVDVLVEKTDRGLKIRINTIEFEFKKSELRSDKTPILDRVAQILEKYKDYDVRIEGHTDNVGSKKKNLDLSKKRADAVYQYLIKKGIKKSRMKTQGFGYLYPFANNKTDEGRKKNRRVEFILIKSK